MSTLKIFEVTGNVKDWGDEVWLVCAESPEDAKAVWSDPNNGGQTEEDGFTFLEAKEVPAEDLMEFGGGDDGWGDALPQGAEVLTRYEEGLAGHPNQIRATAGALATYFGQGILTDPLA